MKKGNYDICIIGAGLSGFYILNKLSNSGLKIICIEIGNRKHEDESRFNLNFEQIGNDVYKGSKEGRSFGIGGTSYLWGGSLLPFTRCDFDKNDTYKKGYDSIRNVFDNFDHISLLRDLLGKEPKKDLISNWSNNTYNSDGFYEVGNVFIPFERKDFSTKKIQKDFEILTSHKLDHFKIAESNDKEKFSISEAICLDLINNQYVSVEASKFFLCAGALESSFIMSKFISSNINKFSKLENKFNQLSFNDHLHTQIYKIFPNGRNKLGDLANKSIKEGIIYGNRYIFKDSPTRSFFHFTADTQSSKSFTSLREIGYSIQQRRLPDIKKIDPLTSISGLLDYSKQRFIDSKLFIPEDSDLFLSYDFECPFSEDRFLKFDHKLGKRFIKWGLNKEEEREIQSSAVVFGQKLLVSLGLDPKSDFELLKEDYWNPFDVYHPSGSLYSNCNSIVNYPDLKLVGTDNFHIFSTASLPSAGTANPTYSLLMLIDNFIKTIK